MKLFKSLLAGVIIFSAAAQAHGQAQPQPNAQGTAQVQEKKPLDHSVYDKWETLGGYAITDNGEWISYYSNREENDGKVVVMNLKSNSTIEIPRGSKTRFNPQGTHLTFTIRPTFAQQKEAKLKKLKGDKAPKDTLGILELATGKIAKFPALKGIETPREGGNFIAFKVEHTPVVLPDSPEADAKAAKKQAKPKTEVITVIYDFAKNAAVDTLKNVETLSFTKKGDRLFCISKTKKGKELFSYNPATLGSDTIITTGSKGDILKPYLSANEKFIAFYANTDSTKKFDENVSIYTYDIYAQGAKAQVVVDNNTAGIPEGMLLTRYRALTFSKDGGRLFFGVTVLPPQKDTTVKEEQAKLDVWHYNDNYISTQQQHMKSQMLRRSYQSYVELDTVSHKVVSDKMIRLAQPEYPIVTVPAEWNADYAYCFSSQRYAIRSQWDANPVCDLYLVSLKDGSSRMIAQEIYATNISASPKGNFLVWYNPQHKQFFSLDMREANKDLGVKIHEVAQPLEISGGIHFPLWKESHDKPEMAPAYGNGGWSADEKSFYIYDKYDVWEVDPLAQRAPQMLTQGMGREKGYTFKMMRWDAMQLPDGTPGVKKTPIGKKDNVYFTAFDNKSKGNGYFMRESKRGKLQPMKQLIMEPDFSLGYLNKAKKANVITYTKGNFVESNNLWVTKDMFKSSKKLTASNPQQAEYNWGTCESVYWTAHDGRELEGLLYKPENLDTTKKYPVLVYFYEKYSDKLFNPRFPAPSSSTINIPYFVSNGYVVFVPDIYFNEGYPGQSAMRSIMPGIEMLEKTYPWIDGENMAIQGQSWGGYQVAYMITQTDRFKAAGAGAPVSNMTSAYGGIRWGSGVTRQMQYERGQSRIGQNLWDAFDLYVENSPLFFVPNVTTPVLIMHNDKDTAVPWYQGIEFFASLRRCGKQAWMLQYKGEDHNLRERHNCKDLSEKLAEFFDDFLKGAPEPEWMKVK
jgi:dipeptidyl aminopeptidase/acylaminoacyl peptidase